jgi:type II secretory pathway component PulF
VATVAIAIRFYLRSPHGKITRDTFMIRAPQLGKISRNFCTARITRLLGTLIESRVPLIDALQLTRGAMRNGHYNHLLVLAEQAVVRGEPISTAFEDARLINPSVCEAIRNGERSGQVGKLLLNISEFMEEENEVVVKSLTSIIEPCILIILGVLVGFIAMSMFLPLFDLTAATGGGG